MMINELISHKKEITLKAKATSEVLFFLQSFIRPEDTTDLCSLFSPEVGR